MRIMIEQCISMKIKLAADNYCLPYVNLATVISVSHRILAGSLGRYRLQVLNATALKQKNKINFVYLISSHTCLKAVCDIMVYLKFK